MISDALGKIAAKGAVFLTALTVIKKFLSLGRNIVLARLLTPEDFGLVALAMVLIQGIESMTSAGFDKYLIQKKNIDDDIISNVWLLNIIRGILLTLLALAVCPLYSRLVSEPATLQVLWIIAFAPLIEGLMNPGPIIAERKMRFGRISIYETICAILEVVLVVILAWFIRDAKALALGLLCGVFLKSLLSYFFFASPRIPKFNVSQQVDILKVAKYFVVISVGTLIMEQGDNLIIGALMGSKKLGLYVIAYQLALFPVQFLQQIANRLAFPVFSNLQINKVRLRSVLGDVIQIQMGLIIPFMIVIFIFSNELISTLYGDKWSGAATILKALVFVMLGKGLTHICVPYIIGTGSFSFASRMKIFETFIFLASIFIGIKYFGLTGAALGAGIGYMTAGIGRLIFICRDADLHFFHIVGYILFPSIAVMPGVLIAKYIVEQVTWHKAIETTFAFFIVCVIYIGFSFLIQRNLVNICFRKSN